MVVVDDSREISQKGSCKRSFRSWHCLRQKASAREAPVGAQEAGANGAKYELAEEPLPIAPVGANDLMIRRIL
jgi:hypothetical protein